MAEKNNIQITAKITGVEYTPFLFRELKEWPFNELDQALDSEDATFILNVDDKNKVAISWWVSAKRTRSYPYTRVYNSLNFSGKKITIIPIFKDEGKEGDRDFLQWDTISLMSLLGINVIIAYYCEAVQSSRYEQKITKQRFDINYLKEQIKKLLSYHSNGLHWNLLQVEKIGELAEKALTCYREITRKTGVEMHSYTTAEKRIKQLKEGKEVFMKLSRGLAELAQKREQVTIQPKEKLDGAKGIITIKNYQGGDYYLTADEVEVHDNDIWLIDAKHTLTDNLPSLGDIKDALLKMILFTNLTEVYLNGKKLKPVPILKLTTGKGFSLESAKDKQKELLETLKKEAKENGFKILLNKDFII